MTPRETYDQFTALHPNAAEDFNPTRQNVTRWNWHNLRASERPTFEQAPPLADSADYVTAQRMALSRSFNSFGEMPAYMQEKYALLASLVPGLQLYACGSRVSGEYIEKNTGDEITAMRKALGKSPKMVSDYDVCTDFMRYPRAVSLSQLLPPWADLLHYQTTDKIPIPMWNFDLLPKEKHPEIIELYEAQNWGELMAMHNEYNLSPNRQCCSSLPVQRWFNWAIKEGIIKKELS